MKKFFLTMAACAALSFSASAVEAGDANIYASGLKVSGNTIEFVLNATPTNVVVNFYAEGVAEPVKVITVDNAAKGFNTVSLEGEFEDLEANTSLTWEVVATAAANNAVKGFSTYSSKVAELCNGGNASAEIWAQAGATVADAQKMEYPYSIAVDKCPTSPNFGNIYVLNNSDYGYGSIDRASGLYVYDSNLNLLNETPIKDGFGMRTLAVSDGKIPAAPYAVTVDEEGFVYISNNSGYNNNGGIFVASPEDVNTFTKLITPPTGSYYFQDIVVTGSGENKVLWALEEENCQVYKYEIGKGQTEPKVFCTPITPSEAVSDKYTVNKFVKWPARICSDKKGGLWVITGMSGSAADYKGDNYGYFLLNHINSEGILDGYMDDYWGWLSKSEDSELTTYYAKAKRSLDIEMNNDGTQLYVAIMGTIANFPVNENGLIAGDSGAVVYGGTKDIEFGRYGGSLHPVTTGIAVDAAGNLYATDLSGYFQAFAPVKADNTYTTKANEVVVVNDQMTGVESTFVDENVPVEYFNLQGVKVAAPENGVFVKKQGSKVTKVVL